MTEEPKPGEEYGMRGYSPATKKILTETQTGNLADYGINPAEAQAQVAEANQLGQESVSADTPTPAPLIRENSPAAPIQPDRPLEVRHAAVAKPIESASRSDDGLSNYERQQREEDRRVRAAQADHFMREYATKLRIVQNPAGLIPEYSYWQAVVDNGGNEPTKDERLAAAEKLRLSAKQ